MVTTLLLYAKCVSLSQGVPFILFSRKAPFPKCFTNKASSEEYEEEHSTLLRSKMNLRIQQYTMLYVMVYVIHHGTYCRVWYTDSFKVHIEERGDQFSVMSRREVFRIFKLDTCIRK